jgi:predicted transcriptional regulator of viral defense system
VCCIDGHSDRKRSTPPWAEVAELAGRQWGVVSRAQLRALSVTPATVDEWVRRGRLHRVHRGVYAVGHTALRVEGRRLAAVLACGPGAVLSHVSAAAHWGLLQTAATRIDVTAPATRRGGPGIRVHRSRFLDARDTTTHEQIPITTIARTLLDLAATVPSQRLERALAQADHLQLYDQTRITDTLTRANGHRATRILAAATANGDPKWTRNDFEADFLTLVRTNGLPEPLVNHILDAPDHPGLEVDFYWPAHALIVETDGWQTHGTKAAFKNDRRKDAALTAAGYTVMRFSYDDVRDHPATVVRRVRAGCCRACASAPAGAWSAASRAP